MDPAVDQYISGSTQWRAETEALRPILLGCGLDEQLKWRKPCYSHEGTNVVIIQEFKAFLALLFFKGSLLDDPAGLLAPQGPNSRVDQRMTFTSVDEIEALTDTIPHYIANAIDMHESGVDVEVADDPLVAELRSRLDGDAALRTAFEALTPGRQREYHLHVSSAKQAATRESRVDKITPRILAGKGLRDR